MNYFAIGHLKAAGGVQVTASHNPAQYNGLKFSQARGAAGLRRPRHRRCSRRCVANGDLPAATRPGHGREPPTSRPTTAQHVLLVPAPPGGRAPAQGGGRRRQRHGGRSTGRSSTRSASSSCRSTSSSTAPSPTTRRTRSSSRTCATCRPRCCEDGADLGVSCDGDFDRAAFVDEKRRAGRQRPRDGADRRRAARRASRASTCSTTCAPRGPSPSTIPSRAACRCASASATRS